MKTDSCFSGLFGEISSFRNLPKLKHGFKYPGLFTAGIKSPVNEAPNLAIIVDDIGKVQVSQIVGVLKYFC